MASGSEYDVREEILRMLMGRVAEDQYPSATMLDMIEEMLTPAELPLYVEALLNRVRSDRFPSIPMLNRIKNLT